MNIYLDLESIPTQRQDVQEHIRAGITAPSQYKKPESIDAWMQENGEAAYLDAVHKTALDGAYGRVLCIGIAFDEQPASVIYSPWEGEQAEARMFAILHDILEEVAHNAFHTTIVGHNIAGFDLRFLMQRHIVNGVKPHPVLHRAAQAKPWEREKVYDTMIQWAGVGGRVSLDKLCRALGIPTPKDGIDGSQVWQAVQDGRIDDVLAYCISDVEATRKVWQRMNFSEAA